MSTSGEGAHFTTFRKSYENSLWSYLNVTRLPGTMITFLSLSLSLTHTHTLTHACTYTLSPPPFPLTHTLSLSLSHTHTHRHARARAHTHTHTSQQPPSICYAPIVSHPPIPFVLVSTPTPHPHLTHPTSTLSSKLCSFCYSLSPVQMSPCYHPPTPARLASKTRSGDTVFTTTLF